MRSRSSIDIKQIFRIAEIDVLIHQLSKPLCPFFLNVQITQKCEFLLRLRHTYN